MWAPPSSVVGGAYIIRPQIALRPVRGAMQARADLPWYWREHLDDKPTPTDYAMTALHTAPTAATALTGAIDGVCELGICGGFANDDHLDRLSAISDLIDGMDIDQVAGIYGDEHARAAEQIVNGFFSSLAQGFKAIVPAVTSVVRSVASVATKAGDFAVKFAQNPRGAIMDKVNELGHVKLFGIPIGAANLIWLADEAARKGLGHDLYKHLEALGPSGIPGSAAAVAAQRFVAQMAPLGSALANVAQGKMPPIPPEIRRQVPGIAAFT
jgi:hypothetical protein